MTRDIMPELLSALILCVVAIALLNPLELWMPTMAHMTMLGVALAAFGSFVVFVLREKASDEREDAHRAAAGRAAFLAGSAVLIVGIAIQSVADALDPWLVAALVAMVIAKVAARIWSTNYR